jgi:hypothetical protein
MLWLWRLAVALAVWLWCGQRAVAKVVQGTLRTGDNWAFVSRFCFLSMQGHFQYEVQYEDVFAVQNIDLYYDTPQQWARVYGRKSDLKSCAEKESVLQVRSLSGTAMHDLDKLRNPKELL